MDQAARRLHRHDALDFVPDTDTEGRGGIGDRGEMLQMRSRRGNEGGSGVYCQPGSLVADHGDAVAPDYVALGLEGREDAADGGTVDPGRLGDLGDPQAVRVGADERQHHEAPPQRLSTCCGLGHGEGSDCRTASTIMAATRSGIESAGEWLDGSSTRYVACSAH